MKRKPTKTDRRRRYKIQYLLLAGYFEAIYFADDSDWSASLNIYPTRVLIFSSQTFSNPNSIHSSDHHGMASRRHAEISAICMLRIQFNPNLVHQPLHNLITLRQQSHKKNNPIIPP
jgi:hypothetical protein